MEDVLGEALRAAASDPARRPDFYRALLESTVFVIGRTTTRQSGEQVLPAGEKLELQSWQRPDGSPVLPFFSSLEALQRALESESSYVALPARALFELSRGADLVMNPRSEVWKEFRPPEIESLLSTGLNHSPETRITSAPRQVLLGQPAVYPQAMVETLSRFFAGRPAVEAAYLFLMHIPEDQEAPRLAVGVQIHGEAGTLMQEAGVVAGDAAPDGQTVDLLRVAPGEEGLSDYCLREVTPFYRRASGAP